MGNNSSPNIKVWGNYVLAANEAKSQKPLATILLQAFIAGMYIAFGGLAYYKLAASVALDGLGQFFGAILFPTGVIAIIITGAELFTSNCANTFGVYAGRSKVLRLVRYLVLVLFANTLGGIFIAFLTKAGGAFSETSVNMIIETAINKTNLPAGQLLASAILCNIIVCSGIALAYIAKNEVVQVLVLWLSITVFVVSGTEHVVANVYYLFAALFHGGPITASGIAYNLSLAALGNFIGGGVIVAGINYLLVRKDI